MIQWGDQLIGHLERAFQIEHLSCPEGMSYGAGHPISAADLVQSSISSEDLEHYPDLFVDEWAAQHLIDQEVGLESLLEFDLGDSMDATAMVQLVLLETEVGRTFLGRKVSGRALEFLVAVDVAALRTLITASVLALLAADAAFGESTQEVRLPSSITNYRPDIVSEEVLRRGVRLMLDQVEGRGTPAWSIIAERQGFGVDEPHDRIVESFFLSVYVEPESW